MILGGGKIGYYLAQRLTSYNINVIIIEQDKKKDVNIYLKSLITF